MRRDRRTPPHPEQGASGRLPTSTTGFAPLPSDEAFDWPVPSDAVGVSRVVQGGDRHHRLRSPNEWHTSSPSCQSTVCAPSSRRSAGGVLGRSCRGDTGGRFVVDVVICRSACNKVDESRPSLRSTGCRVRWTTLARLDRTRPLVDWTAHGRRRTASSFGPEEQDPDDGQQRYSAGTSSSTSDPGWTQPVPRAGDEALPLEPADGQGDLAGLATTAHSADVTADENTADTSKQWHAFSTLCRCSSDSVIDVPMRSYCWRAMTLNDRWRAAVSLMREPLAFMRTGAAVET